MKKHSLRVGSLSEMMCMAALLGLALGCGDDGGSSGSDAGSEANMDASPGTDGNGQATTAAQTAWFFSQDAEANAWIVTVIDPEQPEAPLASLTVEDLAALSGPESAGGNGQGPSWGDAVPSTDHRRIFANAGSIAKVAVFEVETRSLEALVDVGERPVHLYNPNDGSEIWSHADGPGAFYVIDQTSLAVSEPVVAALENRGHGKLLYAGELGSTYYATNTNDPGAFPIDGAAKTAGAMIALCGVPCADDPQTPEDESQLTCGGTHDKVYNPRMEWAIFECSGDARGHYAFVNTGDNSVIEDLVPMSGSIAHSPGNEYILIINAGADTDQVQIWDTGAPDHNGLAFDTTVTVDGGPSARGTEFRQNDSGTWEAWIPQTAGTKIAVVNLATSEVELVEIGVFTAPQGEASRRAAIGGNWLFTHNDQGVVMVNLATKEVIQGPALDGVVSRVAFVDVGAP